MAQIHIVVQESATVLFSLDREPNSVKLTLEAGVRERVNFWGADLKGAVLKGATLKEAALKGADLEGADLEGADLERADLGAANLKGTNLKGTNLRGANLRGAALKSADLEGTDLEGTDLEGTDLEGTDLEGVFIMWKQYRRKGLSEMRPYIPGEDMTGISVSATDTPTEGGMIARNPDDYADQWYVAPEYFSKNLEEVVE